jgi:hypothetical protein
VSGFEKKIICDYEFPAQLDDELLATVNEWMPPNASAVLPSEIANDSVMILHRPAGEKGKLHRVCMHVRSKNWDPTRCQSNKDIAQSLFAHYHKRLKMVA